jgi:hypothetical protein
LLHGRPWCERVHYKKLAPGLQAQKQRRNNRGGGWGAAEKQKARFGKRAFRYVTAEFWLPDLDSNQGPAD